MKSRHLFVFIALLLLCPQSIVVADNISCILPILLSDKYSGEVVISETVDSKGAEIVINDSQSYLDGLKMTIPPNAFNDNAKISISFSNNLPPKGENFTFLGKTIGFKSDINEFYKPIIVQIPYKDEDNDGFVDETGENELDINVFRHEADNIYSNVQIIERNSVENYVTIQLSHFSYYNYGSYISLSPNTTITWNSIEYPSNRTSGSSDEDFLAAARHAIKQWANQLKRYGCILEETNSKSPDIKISIANNDNIERCGKFTNPGDILDDYVGIAWFDATGNTHIKINENLTFIDICDGSDIYHLKWEPPLELSSDKEILDNAYYSTSYLTTVLHELGHAFIGGGHINAEEKPPIMVQGADTIFSINVLYDEDIKRWERKFFRWSNENIDFEEKGFTENAILQNQYSDRGAVFSVSNGQYAFFTGSTVISYPGSRFYWDHASELSINFVSPISSNDRAKTDKVAVSLIGTSVRVSVYDKDDKLLDSESHYSSSLRPWYFYFNENKNISKVVIDPLGTTLTYIEEIWYDDLEVIPTLDSHNVKIIINGPSTHHVNVYLDNDNYNGFVCNYPSCTYTFPKNSKVQIVGNDGMDTLFGGWTNCPDSNGLICTIDPLDADIVVEANWISF